MFYLLTSTLFSTVDCETSNPSTFKCISYMRDSNASDTEFRLSIALGNEMDMARLSLTLLISK